MKVAFSVWNGRIAPVFDVAGTVIVREVADGKLTSDETVSISVDDAHEKINTLLNNGVSDIVCGALSMRFQVFIEDKGIKVFPFISGDIDEVCAAFVEGRLDSSFSMPGCGKRNGQGGGRGRGRGRSNRFNNF